MKKIDLHIHTMYTISDSKQFKFSLDSLREYVEERNLDAIAITNHNSFNKEQYLEIRDELSIPVFPGVELDLCGGHVLLISATNDAEVDSLDERCLIISKYIKEQSDYLTMEQFYSVFPKETLSKYLLIPHYDKKPAISSNVISELNELTPISAGEVSSAKKFVQSIKKDEKLVPVFFSDSRMMSNLRKFSNQQTFLDIEEVTLSSLKYALKDKNKVFLTEKNGHELFNVTDKILASTGLNIVLGERSSGKTHTLNELQENHNNIKYVQQFELVEQNPEDSEVAFKKKITEDESTFRRDYLEAFSSAVDRVLKINTKESEHGISNFCNSLLEHAENLDKQDNFSKTTLFNETLFNIKSLESLEGLIRSVTNILDNKEYREVIDNFLVESEMVSLITELINIHKNKNIEIILQKKVNETTHSIKSELQLETSIPKIIDVKFTDIAREMVEVDKFNSLVSSMNVEKEIKHDELFNFKIIGKRKRFGGAGELKSFSKTKGKFSDAFSKYENAFEFLQELKNISSLEEVDYYKYFFKIEFKILNEHGFEVSGGERAEFNFLNTIEDSLQYEMLLIDEPESSFDNLFLNNKINKQLKNISKKIPVFVVTHNNTIGASIIPDYIIHTKKELNENKDVEFVVYTGFPTDKILSSWDGRTIENLDVQLNCLEAGKEIYDERNQNYELLKN